MTQSIQPIARATALDVTTSTNAPTADFQALLAGSLVTPASSTSPTPAPTTYVDKGPGGSGNILQLDGNGRIMCTCPECVAARQAATNAGANADATATSAIKTLTARAGILPQFSTAAITAARNDMMLGRPDSAKRSAV
ncbi:MAG: hypothetical protein JWM34_3467 [Ilumatobacteraceae bacterium]|nr:hypothetical protein [Ilumatobacteraceae bacterium]